MIFTPLKTSLTFILLAIGAHSSLIAQNVTIPNAIFKAALVANSDINTNNDSEIQTSEATSFTGKIDVSNQGIDDLTGIEAFVNFTDLDVSNNILTALDLSSNSKVKYIDAQSNEIVSIDITACIDLENLILQSNRLTALDVSKNVNLDAIFCTYNELTSIDVSAIPVLRQLECTGNNISTLDLSNNPDLINLQFGSTKITSIDISNQNLKQLSCSSSLMTALDLSLQTNLTSLTISYSPGFTSIDLSNNLKLYHFRASGTSIKSVDLGNHPNLSTVDLSSNSSLVYLNVANGNNTNISNSSFDLEYNNQAICVQVDDTLYSKTNWTNIEFFTKFSTNCPAVELGFNELLANSINVFPNPSSDFVNINTESSTSINVTMYDVFGRVISKKSGLNVQLNVAQIIPGIYSLQIESGDSFIWRQIKVN
jgi:hypothetical protein